MPKVARELSENEVEALQGHGRWAVGGVTGLFLQVKGNSRCWILRIKFAGKRREFGLGSCRDVALRSARISAARARAVIGEGNDWCSYQADLRAEIVKQQQADERVREILDNYHEFVLPLLPHMPTGDAKKLVAQKLKALERKDFSYSYVRDKLVQSGFAREQIPNSLIDVKREQLKIKRFLREL